MYSSFLPLLLFISTRVTYSSLSYGCFMDGCNPQRDFCLGGAYVPYLNKQSLKLNWTFTTVNFTFTINNTINRYNNDTNFNIDQYLGCATNVENGISNTVQCLFKKGLFTMNQNGELLWSYSDPIISSEISNISSVPLLLPYDTTIIDTGTYIMAFNNGIFDWQELISNLSIPTNSLSKWSVGFVEPEYFSISLGDGRFSVYDYTEGMCWASLFLTYQEEQYLPIAVTSSINRFIYVIGAVKDDIFGRHRCAIFAFQIGDVTYRLQTRWVYEYSCNNNIGYLGMSVIEYLNANDTNIFPVGTIIAYSFDNNTNETGLFAIRDVSEHRWQYLWTFNVNKYCGMGYLIDPHDVVYGLNGVWICDYYQNDTLLLKQVNITNGTMISEINVNNILFDIFSINNNWKDILSVNISSRGVSGFSADLKHYVIVLCVNVMYRNQENDIVESNILMVVDIERQYVLSWYIFDTENKCVGQLSATTDGKIIVALSDGMSVVAISA
eukprot:126342_1